MVRQPTRQEIIGSPSARVVPFDYVARLELIGRPKNIVETEVPINVEGGFVATALGYGLAVQEKDILIQSGTENGSIDGTLTDENSIPYLRYSYLAKRCKQGRHRFDLHEW